MAGDPLQPALHDLHLHGARQLGACCGQPPQVHGLHPREVREARQLVKMFRPGLVRLTLSSSLVWTAWSGARRRRRRRRRRWGGRPPVRKQPMSIDALLKLNMSVLQKPALCPISQQLALKISTDILLVSLLTEYNST